MLNEKVDTPVQPKKPRSLHINCDTIEPRFHHNVSPISTQPTLYPSSILSTEEEPKRHPLSTSAVLSKFRQIPAQFKNIFYKNNNDNLTEKSRGKMAMQLEGSNSDRVVRHSYSDPRLSPGSTAVGDEEENSRRTSYFTVLEKKKKRSTRRWLIAALMILFGALIAVTFVLVGLGKAAGHSSPPPTSSSSFVQAQSSTTSNYTLQPSSNITTTTIIVNSHSIHPTVTSRITSTDTVTKILIVDASKYKMTSTNNLIKSVSSPTPRMM